MSKKMKIAFLSWNAFHVHHFLPVAKCFEQPDFLFIPRNTKSLNDLDLSLLASADAYSRYLRVSEINRIDGEYDAVIAQNHPRLAPVWKKTKFVGMQYSLAKDRVVYNPQWALFDSALVYGAISARKIRNYCKPYLVGNPRFEDYFSGNLDRQILSNYRRCLDSSVPTVIFAPTWQNSHVIEKWSSTLAKLANKYNIIISTHHNTREINRIPRAIDAAEIASATSVPHDSAPYLYALSDLVVTDGSGAGFDAMYCGKEVVFIGNERDIKESGKSSDFSPDVKGRGFLGSVAEGPADLEATIEKSLSRPEETHISSRNRFVKLAYAYKSESAMRAANAIESTVQEVGGEVVKKGSGYDNRKIARSLWGGTQTSLSDGDAEHLTAALRKGKADKPLIYQNKKKKKESYKMKISNNIKNVVKQGAKWALKRKSLKRVTPLILEKFIPTIERKIGQEKFLPIYRYVARIDQKQIPRLIGRLRAQGSNWELGRCVEIMFNRPDWVSRWSQVSVLSATGEVRFSRRRVQCAARTVMPNSENEAVSSSKKSTVSALKKLGYSDYKNDEALKVERVSGAEIDGADLLHEILLAASKNTFSGNNEVYAFSDKKVQKISSIEEEETVDVLVPISVCWGTASKDSAAMRRDQVHLIKNIFDGLDAAGVKSRPIYQLGWRRALQGDSRRFSFSLHSKGSYENRVHYKIGSYPGYFSIDLGGFSGWANSSFMGIDEICNLVRGEQIEAHYEFLRGSILDRRRTKYSQSESSSALPEGEFVFLPMQVVDDLVADLAYIDTITLAKNVIQWAENRRYPVVIKRHPKCSSSDVSNLLRGVKKNPFVSVYDGDIHSAIAKCRLVVTVNSGVGAEALLYLKPVVITGASDYQSVARKAVDSAELFNALDESGHVDESVIKPFLYWYTRRYMVHAEDKEAIFKRVFELTEKLWMSGKSKRSVE